MVRRITINNSHFLNFLGFIRFAVFGFFCGVIIETISVLIILELPMESLFNDLAAFKSMEELILYTDVGEWWAIFAEINVIAKTEFWSLVKYLSLIYYQINYVMLIDWFSDLLLIVFHYIFSIIIWIWDTELESLLVIIIYNSFKYYVLISWYVFTNILFFFWYCKIINLIYLPCIILFVKSLMLCKIIFGAFFMLVLNTYVIKNYNDVLFIFYLFFESYGSIFFSYFYIIICKPIFFWGYYLPYIGLHFYYGCWVLVLFIFYIFFDVLFVMFVETCIILGQVVLELILKLMEIEIFNKIIITKLEKDIYVQICYIHACDWELIVKNIIYVYITESQLIQNFSLINWLVIIYYKIYYKIAYLLHFIMFNFINDNEHACVWCWYNYRAFLNFYLWFIVLMVVNRYIKYYWDMFIFLLKVLTKFISFPYYIGFLLAILRVDVLYKQIKVICGKIVVVFSKVGFYSVSVLGPLFSLIFPSSSKYENKVFTRNGCHIFFLLWLMFVWCFIFILLWGYGVFNQISFVGLIEICKIYKINLFLDYFINLWIVTTWVIRLLFGGVSVWFNNIISFIFFGYLSLCFFVISFWYFKKNKVDWFFIWVFLYIFFIYDNLIFFLDFLWGLIDICNQMDDQLYIWLNLWMDFFYLKCRIYITMFFNDYVIKIKSEKLPSFVWFLESYRISNSVSKYYRWIEEVFLSMILMWCVWKTKWLPLNIYIRINSVNISTFKSYSLRMIHFIVLICLWFWVLWYLFLVKYMLDINTYIVGDFVYFFFIAVITHMIDLQALVLWDISSRTRGGGNMHNAIFIWFVHVVTTFISVFAVIGGMIYIVLLIFESCLMYFFIVLFICFTLWVNWGEPLYTFYVRFCNRIDIDEWAESISYGTIELGLNKADLAAIEVKPTKPSVYLKEDLEIFKLMGEVGYKRWKKDRKTNEFMRNEPAFKEWKIYTFDGLHIAIAVIMAKAQRDVMRKNLQYANKDIKICIPTTPKDFLVFYEKKWVFLRVRDKKKSEPVLVNKYKYKGNIIKKWGKIKK